MAEEEFQDDKTLDPTERRLQKAREEGQVARSIDLTAAVITAGSMGLLMFLGHALFLRITHLFAKGFEFDRITLDRPEMLIGILGRQILEGLIVVFPLIAFTLLAACLSTMAMMSCLSSGVMFTVR